MAGKDRILLRLISDGSAGQQTPEPAGGSEVDDAGLLDAFSRTVVDVAERIGPAVVAFAGAGASTTPTIRLRPCWGRARA